MEYPDNFVNIIFVIEDLGLSILKKIEDYTKIQNNSSLKKDFYNIDFVYMHSILLDMGKLLAVGKCDKSGLTELERLSPFEFKEKINEFKEKHKNTIEKITSNRNRIIAHIDISEDNSYFNMGFSKSEIDRKIKDFEKYVNFMNLELKEFDLKTIEMLKAFESKEPKNERYSPLDFFVEKDVFRDIVSEILDISRSLNYYFYNLN